MIRDIICSDILDDDDTIDITYNNDGQPRQRRGFERLEFHQVVLILSFEFHQVIRCGGL